MASSPAEQEYNLTLGTKKYGLQQTVFLIAAQLAGTDSTQAFAFMSLQRRQACVRSASAGASAGKFCPSRGVSSRCCTQLLRPTADVTSLCYSALPPSFIAASSASNRPTLMASAAIAGGQMFRALQCLVPTA